MTAQEIIEKIRAEVERRKGYISVTHFVEELLSVLSDLEKEEKPMNPVLKDFPTTEKEMQDFLATHERIPVPERLNSLERILQEQPVDTSEDERINTAIFKALSKKDARDVLKECGVDVGDALDYLKRQSKEQPVKTDIVEDLKHYLATTPKEQIEKDWESLKEWGKVGPSVSEFLGWEQPICEGLEEEIDKRWKEWISEDKEQVEGVLPKSEFAFYARHFAQWGAEHLKK